VEPPGGADVVSLDDLRDASGTFRILAVDHRDSLRAFLAPDAPIGVAAATLTSIKIDLVRAIGPHSTGVMLEPEYSIPQVLDAGALPAGLGFVAALESQGYLADPGARPTTVLTGWSAAQAAEAGAAAAKLLLPYHPDHPLAEAQHEVAADVLESCRAAGLPLVLEPLFFGLADPSDRPRVVRTTVDTFVELAPDLLKLPFPVDIVTEPDPDVWFEHCSRITGRCTMPWTLLSGGGTFDAFAAQAEVAMRAGCSGYMVGRALWGEAARASGDERARLIDELVLPRWRRLHAVMATGGAR
jgi:tagatose-1,6-bisphosphate aldolase